MALWDHERLNMIMIYEGVNTMVMVIGYGYWLWLLVMVIGYGYEW